MSLVSSKKVSLAKIITILLACAVFLACSATSNTKQPSTKYNLPQINSDGNNAPIEQPYNRLSDEVIIEELDRLLDERNYLELTSSAANLIQTTDSHKTHSYIYESLSKACFENNEIDNALLFLILAIENCDHTERDQLTNRNINILRTANPDMISAAISQIENEDVEGALLYKFASVKYDEKNYNDAKQLLDILATSFPNHEKTPLAEDLIACIDKIMNIDLRRIGCLLPLSGPYRAYGNKALNGIMYALNEFNQKNPDTQFEITVMDTGSENLTGAQLVTKLDESRVSLIIGPLVHSEQAAAEAQKRNIPIITFTQKEGICDIGDFVFRHFITARMQVEAILASATKNFDIRRFAILYPNESYGVTFAEIFKQTAPQYGVTIKEIKAYEPNQTDFGDQIRSMVRYKETINDRAVRSRSSHRRRQKDVIIDFDALFIPDSFRKISMLAPQLDYHDVNGVLLFGTNLWHSDQLIALAGDYVQEAVVPDIFFRGSTTQHVKRFVSDFQSQFGTTPGFMEAITYDTNRMVFQVLSRHELFSRDDVKIALNNMNPFNGITGITVFDDTGEAQKNLYLLQIVGNQFVELEKSGSILSYLKQ